MAGKRCLDFQIILCGGFQTWTTKWNTINIPSANDQELCKCLFCIRVFKLLSFRKEHECFAKYDKQ